MYIRYSTYVHVSFIVYLLYVFSQKLVNFVTCTNVINQRNDDEIVISTLMFFLANEVSPQSNQYNQIPCLYVLDEMIHLSLVIEKLNLFISYTHKDNTNDFAQRLHDDLEQQGWEVFIDTDNIRIGDELPTKIVTAIDKCHGMIVFIKTKNYNKSDWCPKEVDYAVSKRKKLYPLLREKIDDDAEPSSVDFHINFTRLLCVSFCEEDRYDESLQKLINSIREVLYRCRDYVILFFVSGCQGFTFLEMLLHFVSFYIFIIFLSIQ